MFTLELLNHLAIASRALTSYQPNCVVLENSIDVEMSELVRVVFFGHVYDVDLVPAKLMKCCKYKCVRES